jgi:hypothetical protein
LSGINDLTNDHWKTILAALNHYDDLIYQKMTNTEKKLSDIEKQAWGKERDYIVDLKTVIPKLEDFFRVK